MKICPICKSRCFDDMKTCYGCMHQFDNELKDKTKDNKNKINANENKNNEILDNNIPDNKTLKCDTMHIQNLNVKNVDICENFHIPEYFEIESFPYVEDNTFDEDNLNYNNLENNNDFFSFKISKLDKDPSKINISFIVNKTDFIKQIKFLK